MSEQDAKVIEYIDKGLSYFVILKTNVITITMPNLAHTFPVKQTKSKRDPLKS